MSIEEKKNKQGEKQNSNQDLPASNQSPMALNPRLTNVDSAAREYTLKKPSQPTCSGRDAESSGMW